MNSKRLFIFGIIVVLLLACSVRAQEAMEIECRVKPLVEQDGLLFRDLNNNGVLDPYEDWRLSPEERARDLLSQMTLKEKAAQMQHPTFVPRPDGSAPAFLEKWAKDLQCWVCLSPGSAQRPERRRNSQPGPGMVGSVPVGNPDSD